MPDFNFEAQTDIKNLFTNTAKNNKVVKEIAENNAITPKYDFSSIKLNGYQDTIVDSLEFNGSVQNITILDDPGIPQRIVDEPDEPIDPPTPNEPEQADLSDLFGRLKSLMNHIKSNYNGIVSTIAKAAK